MTKPVFAAAAVFAGLLCGSRGRAPSDDASLLCAAQLTRPEALRSHAEFLADAALEGRGIGSRGHDLAVKYLRSQFAGLGLRGGARDGGFFQRIPLRRAEVQAAGTGFVLKTERSARELFFGTDFLLMDTHGFQEGGFEGPIVFAGFGVSAGALGYDDYAGLDVKDKVVAFLSEAPTSFPATLRACHSDHRAKRLNAAAHGALGVIELRTPGDETRFSWPFLKRELAIGWNSVRWLESDVRPHGLDGRISFWAVLNRSGSEALMDGENHPLDELFRAAAGQGKPPAFPLEKTVRVRFRSRHFSLECANVVALLEGTDPVLKNEYIVLSSHVDHLGIGGEIGGDAIYNGAWDSAAGCGILVEVARGFQAGGPKPKRSLLFLAVMGEETGVLRSEYFVQPPTVPAERIVADINVDGGGAALFPTWTPASRAGIPPFDGLAAVRRRNVNVYHSAKDDTNQAFDYDSGARMGQFVLRLVHAFFVASERPKWNSGDFFERRLKTTAGPAE